jgi:hypothetical protein
MVEDGVWLSRRQRRTFHQPRLRREPCGELVQIDGSQHRWFEDRDEPCTLLVFIDDATSKLMQLRFVPSESTEAYFQALRGYSPLRASVFVFAGSCPCFEYIPVVEAMGIPKGFPQIVGRSESRLYGFPTFHNLSFPWPALRRD